MDRNRLTGLTQGEAARMLGLTQPGLRTRATRAKRAGRPFPAPVRPGRRGRPAIYDLAAVLTWARICPTCHQPTPQPDQETPCASPSHSP